jgi:hypothetical protein
MGVITISRQLGSGGDEIAGLVCERLGYQRFDKKVMAQVGQEMGIAAAKVQDAVDFKPQAAKTIWEAIGTTQRITGGDPSSWTFGARSDALEGISAANLMEVINAGYKKGNVVIVGRGGMAALQDKPDVLHVRIVAPVDLRIKRVRQREGMTEQEALQRVAWRDRTDVEWIKRYFDLDSHEPGLYDLVINTRNITPAVAVEMILDAFKTLPAKGK